MHYSFTALVLATITVSQVIASPHGHQAFHEKKDLVVENVIEAEADVAKREPDLADVDWSKVHYTYSVGQTWGDKTAAPVVAAATGVPAPVAPVVAAAAPAAPPAAPPAPASNPVASGIISTTLSAVASTKLTALGVAAVGLNALTKAGGVWIGADGDYTNEFTNASGDDIIVVVWGSWASWVNVKAPLITVSLAPGEKTTVSFATGSVGAWSAIYPDTQLVNGQISGTWGEYTFAPSGVVDVSREVNMSGHPMSIVGPTCTSDMDTCVFKCLSGNVCTTGYELVNCANGSQKGATNGLDDGGAPSGGCGWNGASTAALKTKLS